MSAKLKGAICKNVVIQSYDEYQCWWYFQDVSEHVYMHTNNNNHNNNQPHIVYCPIFSFILHMFSINLVSFILLHLCVCNKVFFPITAQKEACVSSQTRGRCLFCPTPSRVWDNFVYLVSSPPLYLSAEAAWDQTSAWATWLACYLYKLLILRAHVAHTYIFSVGNGHLNSVYECNLHTGCVTDTSEYLKQWETSVCPEEDVLQQQLSLESWIFSLCFCFLLGLALRFWRWGVCVVSGDP